MQLVAAAYVVEGYHQQHAVLLSQHGTVTIQVVLWLRSSLFALKQQSDLFLAWNAVHMPFKLLGCCVPDCLTPGL